MQPLSSNGAHSYQAASRHETALSPSSDGVFDPEELPLPSDAALDGESLGRIPGYDVVEQTTHVFPTAHSRRPSVNAQTFTGHRSESQGAHRVTQSLVDCPPAPQAVDAGELTNRLSRLPPVSQEPTRRGMHRPMPSMTEDGHTGHPSAVDPGKLDDRLSRLAQFGEPMKEHKRLESTSTTLSSISEGSADLNCSTRAQAGSTVLQRHKSQVCRDRLRAVCATSLIH